MYHKWSIIKEKIDHLLDYKRISLELDIPYSEGV